VWVFGGGRVLVLIVGARMGATEDRRPRTALTGDALVVAPRSGSAARASRRNAVYKFEGLDVWRLALDYVDLCYVVTGELPRSEDFNLKSQLERAAVSVALNLAEGSTGLSDVEQARFVSIACRSLLETVACFHIIHRRKYLADPSALRIAHRTCESLFFKLQALRASLDPQWKVREEPAVYEASGAGSFDD
jgi:four helix bundle protein